MITNIQSYTSKVKSKMKKLKEQNKNFNATDFMKMLVFERFVDRVNVSRFKDDIIFKGGFILAHKFDVVNRSSGDLDYIFKLHKRNDDYKKEIFEMINEIVRIDLNDGMNFATTSYGDIMNTKEFDGIRVNLTGTLYNFKSVLTMDIMIVDSDNSLYEDFNKATYKSIDVLDKKLIVNEDTVENIISDKLSAIVNLGIANTRYRDFYDLYLFNKYTDLTELNSPLFKELLLLKIKKESNEILQIVESVFSSDVKIKE